MKEKYLKAIEALGEIIISRDLEVSVLKYENEKLKEKIESIEKHVDSYVSSCE